MDNFFKLTRELKSTIESGGSTIEIEDSLYQELCNYGKHRFEKGYTMGLRHGAEGKVEPIVKESTIKEAAEKMRGLARGVLLSAETFETDKDGNAPLTSEMERDLNRLIEVEA